MSDELWAKFISGARRGVRYTIMEGLGKELPPESYDPLGRFWYRNPTLLYEYVNVFGEYLPHSETPDWQYLMVTHTYKKGWMVLLIDDLCESCPEFNAIKVVYM